MNTRQLKNFTQIIISILLLVPFTSFSQNIEQNDSLRNKCINAAREIMSEVKTCALITIDEKGLPTARTMDPFLPESDFTVWLGTNPKSRKVNQIKNNPNVALYYFDSNATGYVIIHGSAHLINDQKEKEKHWKTEWNSFYPNKSEDYLSIKVVPASMEVVSYKHGITSNSETWKPPVVYFKSEK